MDPINLQIVYLDGRTVDVSAVAADMVAFERHFDLSVARIGEDVRLEHLFFLAWHAEKRGGQTQTSFDEWIDLVEFVASVEVKK
jgi:hypothetical protein